MATVALTILAAPAFAAEIDPSTCPVPMIWQNAYNKGDAAGIAALYTPDAIEVSPGGIIQGPEAVKERVTQSIKNDGPNSLKLVTQKCTIEGPIRWSVGQWDTKATPGGGASGFWTLIEVKSGDTFKIKNLTYTLTPPPAK